MLRRLLSSIPINKVILLNCIDCRLYNRTTKLCKINKLIAFENRLDDTICGIDGKKFWSLDKTNLIKSEKYNRISDYTGIISITSLPCAMFFDYRLLFLSYISFTITAVGFNMSLEYKQKYLDDNDINDDCNK